MIFGAIIGNILVFFANGISRKSFVLFSVSLFSSSYFASSYLLFVFSSVFFSTTFSIIARWRDRGFAALKINKAKTMRLDALIILPTEWKSNSLVLLGKPWKY